MEGTISRYEYSILDRQEESTCLNPCDEKWVVSIFEHGMDHPIGSYDNLKDACVSFIETALPGPKWTENKKWFLEQTKDI